MVVVYGREERRRRGSLKDKEEEWSISVRWISEPSPRDTDYGGKCGDLEERTGEDDTM